MIQGKVGSKTIQFSTLPRGKSGEVLVRIAGGPEMKVRFERNDQGIWIETPKGYLGFDARKTVSDEGKAEYALLQRKGASEFVGTNFLKAGEESLDSSGAQSKKKRKLRSQMPGKILKVFVQAGDVVQKGQALLVMEAMKMENEIKAPEAGTLASIKVTEGQAVETGAELLSFE